MNTTRVHLAFSALMGATGVVLLAAATHGGGIANVQTAGNFLLFHAPAIMAATMARRAMLLPLRMGAVTISLLIAGVLLFAGDLALRGLADIRAFPMAAPLGGTLMIAGWLGLLLSVLIARTDE
jgi:uncharacterized membrane protein YgdD (TMEM256/DUF423 family)